MRHGAPDARRAGQRGSDHPRYHDAGRGWAVLLPAPARNAGHPDPDGLGAWAQHRPFDRAGIGRRRLFAKAVRTARTCRRGSRRSCGAAAAQRGPAGFVSAACSSISDRRAVLDARDTPLPLTSGEFELLRCFVDRPGRVLSRDQLIEWTRGRSSGRIRSQHRCADEPASKEAGRERLSRGWIQDGAQCRLCPDRRRGKRAMKVRRIRLWRVFFWIAAIALVLEVLGLDLDLYRNTPAAHRRCRRSCAGPDRSRGPALAKPRRIPKARTSWPRFQEPGFPIA